MGQFTRRSRLRGAAVADKQRTPLPTIGQRQRGQNLSGCLMTNFRKGMLPEIMMVGQREFIHPTATDCYYNCVRTIPATELKWPTFF